MQRELEIECKTLITKNVYERLLKQYDFRNNPVVQTNHYFDTQEMELHKKKTVLRIREKTGSYTLTLKEPHPEGSIESHFPLTEAEAKMWMNEKPSFNHKINELLTNDIQSKDLKYIGSLTTNRAKVAINEFVLFLDESFYNGKVDYELEIEGQNKQKTENFFKQILKNNEITNQKVEPKFLRFLNSR